MAINYQYNFISASLVDSFVYMFIIDFVDNGNWLQSLIEQQNFNLASKHGRAEVEDSADTKTSSKTASVRIAW